jgi:hypothetical protein
MIFIYILTAILILMLIVYFIATRSQKTPTKQNCVDLDLNSYYDQKTKKCVCKVGYSEKDGKCQLTNPEGPREYCGYTSQNDFQDLKVCETQNDCTSCSGDGKIFGCVEIKEGESKYLSNDDEKDNKSVPEGKYCLPLSEEVGKYCDPRIAYQILSYDDITNSYYWGCFTKYPYMFLVDPKGSTYNQIACGNIYFDGKPSNPILCQNGYEWNDEKNGCDPIDGICKCNTGYNPENINIPNSSTIIKMCIKEPCTPGTTDNQGICICPDGYISCPGDIAATPESNAELKLRGNMCLTDPCRPGGTYSPKDGRCICETGYLEVKDDKSYVGSKCIKICENNGPCDVRGTCKLKNINGQQMETCECNSPYGPSSSTDYVCSKLFQEYNQYCEKNSDCLSNYCRTDKSIFGDQKRCGCNVDKDCWRRGDVCRDGKCCYKSGSTYIC